ncbi:MAG: radical SAM protein [Deltaproteobacteria bacterium]|nr:radical SAM protein [Deltaproteobacteria bacterium]
MDEYEIEAKLTLCRNSAITAWARGETILPGHPWLVYLNLTNLCNNRCGMCPLHQVMRAARGMMPFELFQRILDQLPGEVKKIYLMKQGEPLLHPNLIRLVRYARRARPDIHLALHTNAILLTKALAEELLPRINSLGISISAINRPDYTRIHGTDNFDRVMTNLTGLSDLLRQMPVTGRPHVFIDYVRQEANRNCSDAAIVDFFQTRCPGLASVDLHRLYNWQGALAEGNLTIQDRLPHHSFPCCVFPWASMTICHDGRVSYCFEEPRENVFLGDITRQGVQDIWNGPDYQRFRENMAHRRFDLLAREGFHCHECSYLWNLSVQAPRNLVSGYSLRSNKNQDNVLFGHLLDRPRQELLQRACDYYLDGEIHQALGLAHLVGPLGDDDHLTSAAAELITLCQEVLHQYRFQAKWTELLDREDFLLTSAPSRYYPLNS